MSLIRIDHRPSRRQLNLFGVSWLVFFGIVGAVVLKESGSAGVAKVLWGIAVLVPAVGWILPAFMRIIYLGMAYAAFPIGLVVSYLILVIVYYLVLTPTGLLMRLVGYDPMTRGFDESADTYWCPRKQAGSIRDYFRQF